jgi:hypothetical protein
MPKQPTEGTAPLYVELPEALCERLHAFVVRTRRTLKGEVSKAVQEHLDREEEIPPAGYVSPVLTLPKKGKGRKGK